MIVNSWKNGHKEIDIWRKQSIHYQLNEGREKGRTDGGGGRGGVPVGGGGVARRRKEARANKKRETWTAYSTLRHMGTRVMAEFKEDKVYDHWEGAKKGKRNGRGCGACREQSGWDGKERGGRLKERKGREEGKQEREREYQWGKKARVSTI